MIKQAKDLTEGDKLIDTDSGKTATVETVVDIGGEVLVFCDDGYCYDIFADQEVVVEAADAR